MFKIIASIVIVCCAILAAVCAAPVRENPEVKAGMSDAFRRGIERFGQPYDQQANESQERSINFEKPKIYSQYTAKMRALGGGKPTLREQYRQHSFFPLAPSVLPVEHPVMPNNKLTPEAAAKIYVPHKPYQFSTDRIY